MVICSSSQVLAAIDLAIKVPQVSDVFFAVEDLKAAMDRNFMNLTDNIDQHFADMNDVLNGLFSVFIIFNSKTKIIFFF